MMDLDSRVRLPASVAHSIPRVVETLPCWSVSVTARGSGDGDVHPAGPAHGDVLPLPEAALSPGHRGYAPPPHSGTGLPGGVKAASTVAVM